MPLFVMYGAPRRPGERRLGPDHFPKADFSLLVTHVPQCTRCYGSCTSPASVPRSKSSVSAIAKLLNESLSLK